MDWLTDSFIRGLFNDTVSSSGYRVSYGRIISNNEFQRILKKAPVA
jgi:hypothetical protein